MRIADKSEKELLQLQADITNELLSRGVVRTLNNPIGDYTEWLVSKSLNLTLVENSKAGHDAIDKRGNRIQIKARRVTPTSKSTQLSAIRNYHQKDFDLLAAVIYDERFNILEALLIPHDVVGQYARYKKHENAHVLLINGPILENPNVKCFKDKLLG